MVLVLHVPHRSIGDLLVSDLDTKPAKVREGKGSNPAERTTCADCGTARVLPAPCACECGEHGSRACCR